jgi:tetratricopeptide (TPR) repeat protein
MPERPSPQSITVCALIWIYYRKHDDLLQRKRATPFAQEGEDDNLEEGVMSQTTLDVLLEAIETLILGCSHSQHSAIHLDATLSSVVRVIRAAFERETESRSSATSYAAGQIRRRSGCTSEAQFDLLLSSLKNTLDLLCSSIDSMVDFFDIMSNVVSSTPTKDEYGEYISLDRASQHGIYIRKTSLGFNVLSFECTARLWTALNVYWDQWRIQQQKQHSHNRPINYSTIINQATLAIWPPSSQQIDRYVHDKCLTMDRSLANHSTCCEEQDAEQSHNLQSCDAFASRELQVLLEHYPEVPAVHYYQFLHSLRQSDRVKSYDALFRYFDYAMIRERRAGEMYHSLSVGGILSALPASITQYAAIEVAAVHWQFGYRNLSLQATQEAIRVAQQYNDGACVAYALGWLAASSGATREISIATLTSNRENSSLMGEAHDLLQRCISRATSQQLHSLASSVVFTAAMEQLGRLTSGQVLSSTGMRGIWNIVAGASRDTGTPSPSLIARAGTDTASSSTATSIPPDARLLDVFAILSKQHMMAASIWILLGHPQMSSLAFQTARTVYQSAMSDRDRVLLQQDALNSENSLDTAYESASVHHSGAIFSFREPYRLDLEKPHTGPGQLSATLIDYGESKSDLNILVRQSHFSRLRQRHIFRGGIHDAYALTAVLNCSYGILTSVEGTSNLQSNTAQQTESLCDTIPLSCEAGRFDEALATCHHILQIASSLRLAALRAKGLLLKCQILIRAKSPNVSAAQVLPPLLETISLARRLSIDSSHVVALYLLAKVYFLAGHNRRARSYAKGCLPFLSQSSSEVVQGEAWTLLAKTHIHDAERCNRHGVEPRATSEKQKNQRRRIKHLHLALSQLQKAIELFRKVQAVRPMKEASYLDARVCHSLLMATGEIALTERRDRSSQLLRSICRSEVQAKCGLTASGLFL